MRRFFIGLILFFCLPVIAGIEITDANIRLMPPGMPNTVAYMVIKNTGQDTLRLVSATTPIAAMAELHQSVFQGEMVTMQPLSELTIAPGKSVVLAPGGIHFMLMQLTSALQEGQSVPMTLLFKNGEQVSFSANVVAGLTSQHTHHH